MQTRSYRRMVRQVASMALIAFGTTVLAVVLAVHHGWIGCGAVVGAAVVGGLLAVAAREYARPRPARWLVPILVGASTVSTTAANGSDVVFAAALTAGAGFLAVAARFTWRNWHADTAAARARGSEPYGA